MTDAGTPSGHCNELISAGRNPQSSFVNLHQIGSSVLPLNLIHPTVYTVVVHQIQGAPCAFANPHLFSSVSGKNSGWTSIVVWPLSRLMSSSRVALGAHHSYRSLLAQISPFIAGDVVKHNGPFLFHKIPSWIKCFHHLLGLGFRVDVVVRALPSRCSSHPHVRSSGASFLRLGLNRGAL